MYLGKVRHKSAMRKYIKMAKAFKEYADNMLVERAKRQAEEKELSDKLKDEYKTTENIKD